jgi:hypothetical protein
MAKVLILKRVSSDEDGTYGVLLLNERIIALTLEDSWKDNRRNVSCIPEGSYLCRLTYSPKFGKTYEVLDVPNRSNIIFHWGNTEKDTEGCILLGLIPSTLIAVDDDTGKLERQPAVLNSKVAFSRFMKLMGGDDYIALTIVRV